MSRPLDVEKIAQLEQRNSQLEGMNAMRGRMTLGMLNEGLQAPRSRIAVVRSGN